MTEPRDQPNLDDPDVWAGFLLGLERGSASGHAAGYADADRNLQQAVAGFFTEHPVRHLIRDIDAAAAREAAAHRPVDARTGPQLVRDAHLSWDLAPPAQVPAEVTDLDDAAGF